MNAARALYDAAWREGLRPEPQMLVSEWADKYRRLPSTAAEPGYWRTDRAPYLREIMDALSTGSGIERVVLMKAAQLGGTECGLNWIGYIIHNAPGVLLMVMPTVDMVKRNTRTRIDPLIADTPELASRVVAPRSRDKGNTLSHKTFVGGELVMAGGNAPTPLRSTPAPYLFVDEVDGLQIDVGGEGDPVALAIKRTQTFGGKRKIFLCSTPTVEGSRIAAAYAETDRRRYFVPCPHCGAFQTLEWARILWPEGEPWKAHAQCEHCGEAIPESMKQKMLAAGEWRATAKGDPRSAGFHISSLYSPFQSWGEIAAEFVAAKRDPSRLKSWVNGVLGEVWSEGERVAPEALAARAENWGDGLPEGVCLITAGVDVQDDRLELEIVGHGRGEETWSLAYHVLPGDPSGPALWGELDAILRQTWPHPTRAVADLAVRAAAVDSGGHFTSKAVEFAALRAQRRIFAIKGASGPGRPPWPRRPSRSAKTRQPLYIIGTDTLKEAFYARLAIDTPGPGFCHFPDGRDAAWFAQLTSERIVTKYRKGRAVREWTKAPDARNEALDCRAYAMAALEALKSLGLRLDIECQRIEDAPMRAAGDPIRAAPAPKVFRSKWIDG